MTQQRVTSAYPFLRQVVARAKKSRSAARDTTNRAKEGSSDPSGWSDGILCRLWLIR